MEKFLLRPYWPHGMPAEEKSVAVDEFERTIYPYWASLQANISISETTSVHQADLRIWKSGHKPKRNWQAPLTGKKADMVRAKELIKERWHQVLDT